MGNALLVLSQCFQRNLTPGPLNTFKGWQELGRYVKKGERALTLCMPVTAKKQKVNPKTKMDEEMPVLRNYEVWCYPDNKLLMYSVDVFQIVFEEGQHVFCGSHAGTTSL